MKKRIRSLKPQLELLENRLALTTSVHSDADNVYIDGDFWSDDHLLVKAHGAGGFTVTDADGVAFTVAAGKRLVVNTFYGDDTVRYKMDGTFNNSVDSQVSVILGPGKNHFAGTLNRDLSDHAKVGLTVIGGGDADVIAIYGTAVAPARAGDKLTDGLAINTGGMSIDATSKLAVKVFGFHGNDRIFFDYQGELDGKLALHATGEDGDDTLSALLTIDSGSTGSIGSSSDAAALIGSYDSDTLTYKILGHREDLASINALIDGDGGGFFDGAAWITDTANTSHVRVQNCEVVNGPIV